MKSPVRYPTLIEVERELGKRSLYEFVKLAWGVVKPGEAFVDGWHIKALCDYLEAVYRGDVRFLIINIPPRHMKSLLLNVFLPAWVWIQNKSKKFLFMAGNESLAIRDSMTCRDLITSPWYQMRWPVKLKTDNNRQSQFANIYSGVRMSYGFQSGFTGQGADYIFIDDPNDAKEIYSEAERYNVNNTFDTAISNRLNDPKKGAIVLIQQRLHQDDLTGHILASENRDRWEHLVLTAEYEGVRFTSKNIAFADPRKELGELLWPERFGPAEIQMEKNKGDLYYAGQFQQRPSTVSGAIYKKEWFPRVHNMDVVARFISADTAASVSEHAAYTSIIVGELTSDYRLFIRHVSRKRLDFPALNREIEDIARQYKPKLGGIVIESKSSGISLVQSLRQSSEEWIGELLASFQPTADKVTRAYQAAVWCENGCVLLPPPTPEYPWLYDFEDELYHFPNAKYADQVDAFNQLILYLENYLSDGLRARRN